MTTRTWMKIYESECGKWQITGNGLIANVKELNSWDRYTSVAKLDKTQLGQWMQEKSNEGVKWRTAPGAVMHLPRDTLRNPAGLQPYGFVAISPCNVYELSKNDRNYRVKYCKHAGTPQQFDKLEYIPIDKMARWCEARGVKWVGHTVLPVVPIRCQRYEPTKQSVCGNFGLAENDVRFKILILRNAGTPQQFWDSVYLNHLSDVEEYVTKHGIVWK